MIVRGEYLDIGAFELDPCNQKPGQPEQVAARLAEELDRARADDGRPTRSLAELQQAATRRLLAWPD